MVKKLTQVLISYRALYILCFIALNFIEFLKASQRGDVWYVAVNCTGLVMMVILFSAYKLKEFVDIFNIGYTVVCLAIMIGIYVHWLSHIGYYNVWQRETAMLNVWWIGILVRYLFRKIIMEKAMPFRPNVTGWLWIALSFFMIMSVSGRIWPLWYFLMFGAFYLTEFSEKQRAALLEGMADGTIISFFGIQIYAYGFRPYDTVRYVGAYGNCNAMALFYLVVYCMVLYKLHLLQLKNAHKGWKLYYLIGAGGLLCFQMFTLCRTAWLVSAFITFVYGIFVVWRIWKLSLPGVFLRGVALLLAICFTFLPVYETIRWLPTIMHYRIWYDGEYDVEKVHSFDPPNSYKYISLEEFLDAAGGRVLSMKLHPQAMGLRNPFVIYAKANEKVDLVEVPWTKDESSLIRLTIYKTYLRDMKWFGNGPDKGFYEIGDTGYKSWHAQNLWIQVGYTYGIFAGIMCIALTIAILIVQGKALLQKKGSPYGIIPFFICLIFFLFGMTEIVWNLGQIIMFLMFFVQHPSFIQNSEEATK